MYQDCDVRKFKHGLGHQVRDKKGDSRHLDKLKLVKGDERLGVRRCFKMSGKQCRQKREIIML